MTDSVTNSHKPLVLLILDGFGYSDDSQYNAIKSADAPTWQSLWTQRPKTLIHTSGMAVGLPEGQMGNSEVGHMTLGAGRVVYQNFTRINKAIADGDFFSNPVYCNAIDRAQRSGNAVHVMGLLSPGGVHSHEDHINAMLEMAAQRGAKKNLPARFSRWSRLPSAQRPTLAGKNSGTIVETRGRQNRFNLWSLLCP